MKREASGPRQITVAYAATCLTCEERVELGEPAWWVSDVGIWHLDCAPPRNLATYSKEKRADG